MGGTMRWAELRMCRFWAGGISSFPFSRAREYRLLRRLDENGIFCIQSGKKERWPPKFVRHGQVYINLGIVFAECVHFLF